MVVKLRDGSSVDCGQAGVATVVRVCLATEAVVLRVGDRACILVPRDAVNGGRCRLVVSHQGLFQVGQRPKRRREAPAGSRSE
jgi:hypothetical protein